MYVLYVGRFNVLSTTKATVRKLEQLNNIQLVAGASKVNSYEFLQNSCVMFIIKDALFKPNAISKINTQIRIENKLPMYKKVFVQMNRLLLLRVLLLASSHFNMSPHRRHHHYTNVNKNNILSVLHNCVKTVRSLFVYFIQMLKMYTNQPLPNVYPIPYCTIIQRNTNT